MSLKIALTWRNRMAWRKRVARRADIVALATPTLHNEGAGRPCVDDHRVGLQLSVVLSFFAGGNAATVLQYFSEGAVVIEC
jgi:hypothetical protein